MFFLHEAPLPVLHALFDPYLPATTDASHLFAEPNLQIAWDNFLLNAGLCLTALFWGLAIVGMLMRSLNEKHTQAITLFMLGTAAGLSLIITELFCLALLHMLDIYHLSLAFAVTGIVAFIAIIRARHTLIDSLHTKNLLAIIPGIFFIILVSIFQLAASNTPSLGDATSYHMPYADFFVKSGGLAVHEQLIYPYHSFNINLLYSLALMLKHDLSFVQTVHALFASLTMLGIYAFCIESKQKLFIAISAPFIFAGLYIVYTSRFIANVDLGGMFFVFFSVYALWLWMKYGYTSFLILSAMFLGIAMGCKYILLILPLPAALCVIYTARPNYWRQLLMYATVAAIFGLWWYVRNIIYTGNPLHPFATGIFGFYEWNAADMSSQMVSINNTWIPRSTLGVLLLPYYAYQSETLRNFGPLVIIGMLYSATLFAWLVRDRLNMLLCFSWIYLLSWIWGSQDPRHLLPIFPLVFVYTGAVLNTLINTIRSASFLTNKDGYIYRPVSIGLTIVTIFMSCSYAAFETRREFVLLFWRNLVPGEAQEQQLKNIPVYDLFSHANEIFTAQDTIFEFEERDGRWFFKGNVVGSPFGRNGYWHILNDAAKNDGGSGPAISAEKLEKILKDRYHAAGMIIPNAPYYPYDQNEFDQHFHLRYRNSDGSIYTWK